MKIKKRKKVIKIIKKKKKDMTFNERYKHLINTGKAPELLDPSFKR